MGCLIRFFLVLSQVVYSYLWREKGIGGKCYLYLLLPVMQNKN